MIELATITMAASLVFRSEGAGIDPQWLFNPVNRTAMIEVDAPRGHDLKLVLMDAEGQLLEEPVGARPGQMDLYEELPIVERLRRAAYLQLLIDGEPRGSSLVVQPMLSRLIPVTKDATNPNGIQYTEIVDWYDETGSPPPARGAEADQRGVRMGEPLESAPPDPARQPVIDDSWLAPYGDEGRLFSGLRLYPERDVVLETTEGQIRLAMRPDHTPNTVWNFLTLCENGFYRDIPFHRIVPLTRDGVPFVIQAGDPTSTGSGGPGYWLPMERSALPHDFGVISMARDVDTDSAGSQFFICLSREGTARLDGHYCAFGETVEGTGTIQNIAASELADATTGRPADPPLIRLARLVDAPPRRPGEGRPDGPVKLPVEEAPVARDRVPR